MARALTQAERLRAHRAAFELAQELGCTPREAQAELDRRAAHQRWIETDHRLRAKMAAPLACRQSEPAERFEPWMMRD